MILEASLHYAWEGVHNREAHILVARKGVGREREREREKERKRGNMLLSEITFDSGQDST
jgi:hypothetical protein